MLWYEIILLVCDYMQPDAVMLPPHVNTCDFTIIMLCYDVLLYYY